MLTNSFCFARLLNEDQERSLWARGVTDWTVLRQYPEEAAAVIGSSKAQKLVEAVNEAAAALARSDWAWFKTNWPERETWRLWSIAGAADTVPVYATPTQAALVDIETTGLTPGYDQITVIGLADGTPQARAYVAGRPQPGDEPLDRFREAIKHYRLIVTFNGTNFDLPFIEKTFREAAFRFDLPHLDLLPAAKALGLSGGLKDMEPQLGIQRDAAIKDMRGHEAIALWGQWKNQGDLAAYQKLTTYCKADCANLQAFADEVYRRTRAKLYDAHARPVDFAKIKGQQLTIF